jgi:signal transduction histidine kinase
MLNQITFSRHNVTPGIRENMVTDFRKILTYRKRYYVLLPVTVLSILPALLDSLSSPAKLAEFALFIIVTSATILLYFLWLSKREDQWAKVTVFILGGTICSWYTFMFIDDLQNAYLSVITLVVVIFLLLGPRYGLAILGLSMVSNLVYLVANPDINILNNIFTYSVEATVGLLSWIFVSAANDMRVDAEQSAAQATAAMSEAQRLAVEVTKLNKMLINSRDDERRRLARDIHDGPLQSLGVELLAVERAKRRLEAGDYEKAGKELEYLRELARENITDLRDTVNSLRNSLLDSGIEPALQNLARKTQATTGTRVEVSISLDAQHTLPDSLAACIYQLAVEGLNNIKKHARANNATLSLEDTQEEVVLRISDDGQGLDYEEAINQAINLGHIGLYSMRERVQEFGGTMSVDSAPKHGTSLVFTFPRTSRALFGTRLSGPLV